MLLPAGQGSRGLLSRVSANPKVVEQMGLGLYLGDPFLNHQRIAADLKNWSVSWVSNLPSVAQHEQAFRDDLENFGFSLADELASLAQYRQDGIKTLAVVSDVQHVDALIEHPADAVLVIQTTKDIQVSFPSLPQRLVLVHKVTDRARECNLDIPVLPLVTQQELQRDQISAVCRPERFSIDREHFVQN